MSHTLEERLNYYREHIPTNKPRVPFRQVLSGSDENICIFYAVILDPDTQKRIGEVEIFRTQPGECVELALERFTVIPGRRLRTDDGGAK